MGRGRYNPEDDSRRYDRERYPRRGDEYDDPDAYAHAEDDDYAEDEEDSYPEDDQPDYDGRAQGGYYRPRYRYPDEEVAQRPVRRVTRRQPPQPPLHRTGPQGARSTRSLHPGRPAPSRPPRKLRRKRSIWSSLFIGCLLGILLVVGAAAVTVFLAINSLQNGGSLTDIPRVLNTRLYSTDETQDVALTQINQMLICDRVGSVSMKVDPSVQKTVIKLKRTVRASSQDEANAQFKKLSVEIQPPGPIKNPLSCGKTAATATATTTTPSPTTTSTTDIAENPDVPNDANSLTINTTLPSKDAAVNKIDLTILLPTSVMASAASPAAINVRIEAPQGDIALEGLSGVLQLRSGTGNVRVKRAILANGSHLETGHGDITFSGFLALPLAESNEKARFLMQSENNIDVTLPANTNITVDANTNLGTITSEFPMKVTKGENSVNYFGPLNPDAGTPAPATLVMNVSAGNVVIHKSQVQ